MSRVNKGDKSKLDKEDSSDVIENEAQEGGEDDDEEMEQEKKKYGDDEDEEEDENEQDENEMADFIVGDEEVDEEEPEAGGDVKGEGDMNEEQENRRKKHRKKKKEIELDEEDLELIQENEGRAPHKKLKKTKEIARSRYELDLLKEPSVDEEANDDFIERDFIDEEHEEEDVSRKRRPTKRHDGHNLLQMVFGQGYEDYRDDDYNNEEGKEEEDEMPIEDRRVLLKKKYEQLFDPAELRDKFATFADEQIIAEDIPERLQLRYKNRFCDNNELVQETNWIADKLIMSKGLIDKNSENFRKNIMKVLEFLRISFYEILYIHTYKANEISLKPGELKLQDLWKIYDLDVEWTSIWSRRKLLEKSFEKVSSYLEVPELVVQLYNMSFDKFNLDSLLDYFDFQTLLHPRVTLEQNDESKEKTFKKAKRVFIKPELKERFDDFASHYLLSPEKFAENIYEAKMKHQAPLIDELLTDLTHKKYVDENIPRLSNPEAFLTQLCDYVAHQLFYNPIVRKIVYRQYFEKIVVSTEPTQKGKKEIDLYNINYCVKRIDGRPLKDIEDEIWLRAIENEKEGKIKIKFHFRWKDFNSDEIFAYLKSFYLYDHKVKNEATSQWNILRTEILTILLKSLMYPYMEKLIRQDLTDNAEKKVVQDCGKKFKEMLNAAPYTKSDGDDVVSEIRVMAFVPDENNKVICVVVDKYGEYMDHRSFSYLLVNEKRAPVEYITKQTMEEEELKKFVEKFSPDLLVVGADNLSAKSLVKYLRDQSQKWEEEVKNVWIKYGDMTAPKIYAKMEVSKKELPEHPIRLKEAISLGRLQQSPLHEILKLWHHRREENGILYIILNDLQSLVHPEKLIMEFEKSAIEVTNQVGIEINKVLKHPHLAHPFQFICGLGPRKAKQMLDSLNQKLVKLTSRRELTEEKLVGKNVFTNMAGFIKVIGDEGRDLLDTTRIHPNDYRLAQKIAKDALDDADHNEDFIKTIMDKPQKLDELDLDDYATHLETKGKQNMKIVLDFIVNELTRPFADPRGAHREMDHKELFYKMTKMHPFDLQYGSLVNARVIRVTDKNIICRLECGIEGNVFIQDVFEGKEAQLNLQKKYHEGQVVTARVVGTNFDEKSKKKDDAQDTNKTIDFTKLHLILKPSFVNTHEKFIKDLHPSTIHTFKIVPEEDFPTLQSGATKSVRYYTRKINHPKFKNTSAQGALSYLEDKEIGDYIVRPSSKGMDHLTLTWKFYDNIFVHLDIKETSKGPSDKIGRKLHLKDQIYESIEELAAGYVYSCNSFVKNVIQSPKFLNEDPARIEEIIKQEKEENPKLIPYRFGFSIEAPQFLVLYYAPKDYNVVREYIKVKPNGLFFHDMTFPNISQLISWFKTNFHKPEYHKYLKMVKPPVALPKTGTQVKGEKAEPSSGVGGNTPSKPSLKYSAHSGRAFDEGIKVKAERDIYVKQEKGINVKEEESRGGDFGRDRNFNRNRGGRGQYGDQDRNRPRDFNRDRPRRDRSKSFEREKDRDRDRSRDYKDGDKNRDRYRERSGNDYGRNRDNQERRNYRNDNRNDRGDRADRGDYQRKDSWKEKKEGGWAANRGSPSRANVKASPGWGKSSPRWENNQPEERKNDGGWGPENESGWSNEAAGDSMGDPSLAGRVKSEWRPESAGWDPGTSVKTKVEHAPSKVKQESGVEEGQGGKGFGS